jgi:hypothetical protein
MQWCEVSAGADLLLDKALANPIAVAAIEVFRQLNDIGEPTDSSA